MFQQIVVGDSIFLPKLNQAVMLDQAKTFLVYEFVKDARIKDINFGEKFVQWFSRKIESGVPECEYLVHPLSLKASDQLILDSIQREGRQSISYLAHIAILWQRQRYGQAGILANSGHILTAYALDSANILRNIAFYRASSLQGHSKKRFADDFKRD